MSSLPHDHDHTSHHILAHMPSAEDFTVMADLFKQLSDSTRVRIFWILCHCEECVINLSAMMEMSSPAVSHHLKQLRSAGLIVSRREGKEVYSVVGVGYLRGADLSTRGPGRTYLRCIGCSAKGIAG